MMHSAKSSTDQALLQSLVKDGFLIQLGDEKPGSPEASFSTDGKGNVSIHLEMRCSRFHTLSLRSKLLTLLPPGHRQYLVVESTGQKLLAERMLSAQADSITLEVPLPTGSAPSSDGVGSFLGFLLLGIKHILTGYDHLLFLLGLLIVTRRFLPTLRIITSFTLAHSVTLTLATFHLIPSAAKLVEPLIAASIVYVGVENLAARNEPKGRWLLAFAFGLIHGCGFASALRELGVGENGGGIAGPLIAFNLGVELGQVAITSAVLPVIWKLKEHPRFGRGWVPITSTLVALLGAYWFAERIWL